MRERETQFAAGGASADRRGAPLAELLDAVVSAWCLTDTVPRVLDAVERDPLASGGEFPGDLVRALTEVPGAFWARHPGLYARYQSALRANAVARRALPVEVRMQFWASLGDRRVGAPLGRRRGDAPATDEARGGAS